jgi:hypothetical protein
MNTVEDLIIPCLILFAPTIIVITSIVIIKTRNPDAQIIKMDKRPQRLAALSLAFILPVLVLWSMIYELHREELAYKEICARPHTAHILDYQVSFPKKIPIHYDGGYVVISYAYDPEGKEGRTRIAEWELSPFGGNFEDGIKFMVNELAQPGNLPRIWTKPLYWEKIVREPIGTKTIDGLNFAITKWTADYNGVGACKLSGIDYLAHDKSNLIGLRAIDSEGHNTAVSLADSVLDTFRKNKIVKQAPKIKDSLSPLANGSVIIGHGGNDDNFIDPYAELIQP